MEHHTVDGCRFALSLHPLQLLDDLLEAAAQLCIGADGLVGCPRRSLGLNQLLKTAGRHISPADTEIS